MLLLQGFFFLLFFGCCLCFLLCVLLSLSLLLDTSFCWVMRTRFQDWPALSPIKVRKMYPFQLLLQLSPSWSHSLASSQADTTEGNSATKSSTSVLGLWISTEGHFFCPPLPDKMQEPKITGSQRSRIGFVVAKGILINTGISKTR